ncbi:nucleotidyltransferase family protein (plasmid) [Leisingera caerulea]|uniref:nucleotidyltransferase family protein n=1 Tax=Leisingera caerulea TaxID=506591 RepID=UPI0021A54281|nr:nucleotidyltransferase family protein [Leisingera caerulea]UWQ51882.1 nucleotidyltransferase family protein [Leisingera caerulea]
MPVLPPTALESLSHCLQGRVPRDADWEQIIGCANEHLVGPLLYRRLVQSGQAGQVDPEALSYLASVDAANITRNTMLKAQLDEVLTALTAEGLEAGLMKGAVNLFQAADAADVARMSFDLDIVTSPDQDAAVESVLSRLGYEKFPDSRNQYSLGSYFRADVAGALDIHHRIPERYFGTISARDIKEHSRLVPFGAGAVRIPNAHLRLVTNLAHDMLHDRGVFSGFAHLRYLIDLIELCADPADPAGWQRVEEKFSTYRFKLGLELQCRLIRHLFPEAGFPEGPRSLAGWALHQRRLLRSRLPRLAELEWQMILRLRQTRFWLWLRQPR